jgi:hypothetical protein
MYARKPAKTPEKRANCVHGGNPRDGLGVAVYALREFLCVPRFAANFATAHDAVAPIPTPTFRTTAMPIFCSRTALAVIPHVIPHAIALASGLLVLAPRPAHGDQFAAQFNAPTLDRWNYPFNPTPGSRITASVFGNEAGSDLFDNRDGQFIVGFDTGGQIPAGLGASSYTISACVLEISYANDFVAEYDPTVDPFTAFLPESDPAYVEDADAGQPIELYATGFRNGFSVANWVETSPYAPAGQSLLAPGIRNAYASARTDGGTGSGVWVDVSNSVRERWTPSPLAVGLIDGLKPGSLIPVGTAMRFELDVSRADVQEFLRDAIDGGRLRFSVTSLAKVVQQGGNFPAFYCRENPVVTATGLGDATLAITETTATCAPADLNCEGSVGAADLATLLGAWGGTGPGDLNGDGTVGAPDLAILLGQWG